MKKLVLIVSSLLLLSACSDNKTTNTIANNTAKNSAVSSTAVNNATVANNSSTTVNNASTMAKEPADLKAYDDKSMTLDARVTAIDGYVKRVETELPASESEGTESKLKRKETDLSKETLAGITDEKWAKMHSYYNGEKLERLKVYSLENEKKTEEFYFFNDKPVFAFIEKDGMSKKGDNVEAKGDKFYFGSEGLIAWIKADGSKVDATSEEFKKYGEKLVKEVTAFRNVKQ